MKQFLVFILAISLFSVSCKEDFIIVDNVVIDYAPYSCDYTEELASNYTLSVKRLLLDEMHVDPTHPDIDLPYFNQESIDELLSVLQAVKNIGLPEADTIFDVYSIHARQNLSLNSILIRFDSITEEVENLMIGQPTGIALFDDLVSNYEFDSLIVFDFSPMYYKFKFLTDLDLNMIPIMEEFEEIPNVYYASFSSFVGDGNKIELTRNENSIVLNFSYGYGDCFAGCIYRRHWIFEIDNYCNAEFIESYGNY